MSTFNELDGVFDVATPPPPALDFEPVEMAFPGHDNYDRFVHFALHNVVVDRSPVSGRLRCVIESFVSLQDEAPARIEMCLLHKARAVLQTVYGVEASQLAASLREHGAPTAVVIEARADLGLQSLLRAVR